MKKYPSLFLLFSSLAVLSSSPALRGSESLTYSEERPRERQGSFKKPSPLALDYLEIKPFLKSDVENTVDIFAPALLWTQTTEEQEIDKKIVKLRSLSVVDHEKGLTYSKEEYLTSKGQKKVAYFDPQADISYRIGKGGWICEEPYTFGYRRKVYQAREDMRRGLTDSFENRLNSYPGSYKVRRTPQGYFLEKREGYFFKKVVERHGPYDIYDAHQFLLRAEKDPYSL